MKTVWVARKCIKTWTTVQKQPHYCSQNCASTHTVVSNTPANVTVYSIGVCYCDHRLRFGHRHCRRDIIVIRINIPNDFTFCKEFEDKYMHFLALAVQAHQEDSLLQIL